MPLTVSRTFTVSLHEKANLRKFLSAWRGRDFTTEEAKAFDVSKLLGAYCMVNVTESETNGKTYSNEWFTRGCRVRVGDREIGGDVVEARRRQELLLDQRPGARLLRAVEVEVAEHALRRHLCGSTASSGSDCVDARRTPPADVA